MGREKFLEEPEDVYLDDSAFEDVDDTEMKSILKRLICSVRRINMAEIANVPYEISYMEKKGGGAFLKMTYGGKTAECGISKTTLKGVGIEQD